MENTLFKVVDESTLRTTKVFKTDKLLPIKTCIIIIGIIVLLFSCVLITQYCIYNKDKQVLTSEIMGLQQTALCNTEMYNLYWYTGKYNLIGYNEIPIDSIEVCYRFMEEIGVWYPKIVFAQLLLESNWGKSMLAQNHNNLFGMKRVAIRPTTQLSGTDYKGYGIYLNWQHCIIDRMLWDEFSFSGQKPTYEKYISVLKKRYAEDTNYMYKLENIISKFDNL